MTRFASRTRRVIFAVEWGKVSPLLEGALARERGDDPAAAIFGATIKGVARAADLLTRQYHLVVTNVPYLARGKQDAVLKKHIETFHNDAKTNLATAFTVRCMNFCTIGGTIALVTPHNWLFLDRYKQMREHLLETASWNFIARLGPGAFETISGEVVNVALVTLSHNHADETQKFACLDAASFTVPQEKAQQLRLQSIAMASQSAQFLNPDARIALDDVTGDALLSKYAYTAGGMCTFDTPRFIAKFWELPVISSEWLPSQSTVDTTELYGGRSNIVLWEEGKGQLYELVLGLKAKGYTSGIWRAGIQIWGKKGILISLMGGLRCTLYTGEAFDNNTGAIVPYDMAHLAAVWAFCSSPEFHVAVRRIDQKMNVTNATLVKVPFDLERWQQVAAEQYPDGLPEPHNDDPTQWLFHGYPARTTSPLHVGMARLLGYRWPQNETDDLNRFADGDGIVCLPPVAGEPPAAQRLRELLASAYGSDWTPGVEERLLAEAGYGGQGLDVWLREGFFAQHCRLFDNRPFLWHIWDGRKDGFGAIVNYHKLDRAKLDRLIYTYLGDWIGTQRHADAQGVAGANARLVYALNLQEKLKAIADGEPPYDIYIRWKPLHKQPIGWEPDINDGVRLNVRPFVNAGVLRAKFSVNWNKDRGINPDGTERLNDLHFTRAQKEAPRRQQEK